MSCRPRDAQTCRVTVSCYAWNDLQRIQKKEKRKTDTTTDKWWNVFIFRYMYIIRYREHILVVGSVNARSQTVHISVHKPQSINAYLLLCFQFKLHNCFMRLKRAYGASVLCTVLAERVIGVVGHVSESSYNTSAVKSVGRYYHCIG